MNDNSKQYKALVQERADLVAEGKRLFEAAEKAERELTAEEKVRDDAINTRLEALAADIKRHESRRTREMLAAGQAPAQPKLPAGHNFNTAFAHWVKEGDKSALDDGNLGENAKGLESYTISAASNATDMNIGTAADGGDTVATGFYNQIIARRDESLLRNKLGVRMIPGTGTTVDVPYDNEADGEFVTKAEANDSDLDAPALAKASMTLVDYTKYTDVSYQLLEDTAANLLAFLADFVGRGWAKTHNSLLLTEVAASGTKFKDFASATAIAAGEPEAMVGNVDLAPYLDDDASVSWVTRSSTLWAIKALTGNPRLYGSAMDDTGPSLLGYPVAYSQKATAPAASAKSIYFGNWYYVGNRESQELNFLRDPYSVSIKRQVRLLWNFRTVYKVLQAEAVGYGLHPTG